MFNFISRLKFYNLIVILTVCYFQSSSQSIYPNGLKTYAAQLHVHGLSNHNGSPQPACMQWHSFYSDTTNTPILWWTDHREVFTPFETNQFNFKNGVYNASTFTISGLSGNSNDPTKWVGVNTGGTVTVSLTDSSINIGMKADATSTFRTIYFSPRIGTKLLVGTRKFVRAVTSRPIIKFDLTPVGVSTSGNGHVQLVLLMSYHYYNGVPKQQSITYNFVSNTLPFSRTLTDSSTLTVNVPVTNGTVNHISLDVAADAVFLKDGIDNTTNDYRLLVEGKQSKNISAKFTNIKIYSQDSIAYSQFLIYTGLGNSYGNRYGIKEYIGCEWSDDSHLNGFLPDSATNRDILYDESTSKLGPQYFSDQVHAKGGVVSFNHPFGSAGAAQSLSTQDYRTDTIAQFLLNNDAYGADILEVGYNNRGGADLAHHLKLWDILTANQLYLYGDGTNDSHGGTWYVNNNCYVTWIWATDSTPVKLIAGLKSGKSFFGDNIKFTTSKFYFKVANAVMGERKVPNKRTAPVKVQMTGGPSNLEFRLTQGLIQSGLVVNYLYHDFVFDTASPPCLSLTSPCFVRVSVYSGGKPVLFSNPIVFTSGAGMTDPTMCSIPRLMNIDMVNEDFQIYPNPVIKEFMLKARLKTACTLKVSLMNVEGKILKYLKDCPAVAGYNEFLFKISDYPNGNYFLLVENDYSKASVPFVISN